MLASFGLSLLFSILLCVHVVRTGQAMYWLMIILLLQPLGGIVYLAAIVLPELLGGRAARKVRSAARHALDPEREYRTAKAAADESPTTGARMRLAAAAAGLGRWTEAEELYRLAAIGIHEDDPALLTGRARALVELNRPAEALPLLQRLAALGEARTPQAALLEGRVHEALGHDTEADAAYQWAAGRLPGLEALARYAAFLAKSGRRDEAREALADIEKRAVKSRGPFRKEALAWRDFAAQAVR